MPAITIDGQRVEAAEGQTILEAAQRAGIVIPTLCHHADLSPTGSCRLCLVEVEGGEHQTPACHEPVAAGMSIRTESESLIHSRRFVLEMLLRNCAGELNGSDDNELLRWVRHYQVELRDDIDRPLRFPADGDPHPCIQVDLNQCILCTRCIRACAEIQGRFVWGLANRGHNEQIIAGVGGTMLDARCESCGACAAYCPTGALSDRARNHAEPPDRFVRTTCGYCGVGCQFDLNVRGDQIAGVTSHPDAPVNGMSLCVKGRYGYGFVHHADRLTSPMVRREALDEFLRRKDAGGESAAGGRGERADSDERAERGERGEWVATDWDTALDLVAEKIAQALRESGPSSCGVLASAKCTNEENYLMQKFARQVLRTNNVDHCARLCHSSTVAGLAMCFGSGAMSNSMDDVVEQAEAVFIIGSNTTEQHPVFGAMIRQAVLRRGLKLIVADPRDIDICEFAEMHLRQRPGTDVALLNGLMHWIVEHDRHDRRFIAERCEGFDEFRETLRGYSPDVVAQITGVPADEIERAAERLSSAKPMAVIWAMGITQHTTGVLNVLSLGNLQMLLGNMGIPGGGVNPLRGQNNVQGACDMGALPNVFPGYQPTASEPVRGKFADAWRCEDARVGAEGVHTSQEGATDSADGDSSDRATNRTSVHSRVDLPSDWSVAGLTVTEMIDAAGRGDLRALYILGEDPAMTEPDSEHARRSLMSAEFIVLQEILISETAAYADVLLPGASFAEKDGTYTNTERRVQLVRQAIDPPGDARPDWWITSQIANRILRLSNRTPIGTAAEWNYEHPSDVMEEIARLTPSYGGVSHARLERGDRLQWPVPSAEHPGTPILHVGKFTRGLGKFHAAEHLDPAEAPDEQFPLILTTGRVLFHWHGGELTRRDDRLSSLYPETLVEIHPDDAARCGVDMGDAVRLRSRRGEMAARAVVTTRVAQGVVFGNFHFPGLANVNNLTISALDPIAKIPEYKVCAVSLCRDDETAPCP